MILFTLDHPTTKPLAKKVKKHKWKVAFITSKALQDIRLSSSTCPKPSLLLLPMYYDQEEKLINQVIEYSDQFQIPILFILNSKKTEQWTPHLPTKAIYDTISSPLKEKDFSFKAKSLLNIQIKLLLAKFREDELVGIKKNIDEELHLAKTIQTLIQPTPIIHSNITLESAFESCSKLSGDLFYWMEIDTNKYGIIIMEVNGFGVHAALISMSMRSLLQGLIRRVQKPAEITRQLNLHMNKLFEEFYHKNNYTTPYFTALIAYIDTEAKSITYVNAGHPPGWLYQPTSEQMLYLSNGSTPLGFVDDVPLIENTIRYEPGSKLLFFTDGLTKANSSTDALLLNTIQEAFIQSCQTKNPDILSNILRTRMQHSEINDDICVIYGALY